MENCGLRRGRILFEFEMVRYKNINEFSILVRNLI